MTKKQKSWLAWLLVGIFIFSSVGVYGSMGGQIMPIFEKGGLADASVKYTQNDKADDKKVDSNTSVLSQSKKDAVVYVNDVYQKLSTICQIDSATPPNPGKITPNQPDKPPYQRILDKFDKTQAVDFASSHMTDLKTLESGLNEYIFCVQFGIDIALYDSNRAEYDKEKLANSAQKPVTVADIEQAFLDVLSGRKASDEPTKSDNAPGQAPIQAPQGILRAPSKY